MVYNQSYTTSIFESLGILSSLDITRNIWEKYEKFAVPKIKDSTIKLRGSLYYLKDISPAQASSELNSINTLIPVLSKLRSVIETINIQEHQEFKNAALDFFDTVDFLHSNLQEIADIHSSYEISKSVLASDWVNEADEHWNNY